MRHSSRLILSWANIRTSAGNQNNSFLKLLTLPNKQMLQRKARDRFIQDSGNIFLVHPFTARISLDQSGAQYGQTLDA
jgi:hypothetical protein